MKRTSQRPMSCSATAQHGIRYGRNKLKVTPFRFQARSEVRLLPGKQAGPVLTTLSRRLSEELRPGTRVITTDKMLAEVCDADGRGFQLLDQIDGSNKDTFFSTGYVWERIDRTNLEELVPRPSPSF
mmetsp:Transcript_36492/g.145885  ORF Transcript_36492/g.145885 Transcript_36492/m.145885 type:complete len:127 (+) Transcript_36492:2583-2963(+)